MTRALVYRAFREFRRHRPWRMLNGLLGVVLVAACTMPNPEYDEDHAELGGTAEGDGDPSTTGDATTTGTSGSSTGDGDPDPNTTTGDGDPDPSTTTGDGDGDPSGDGDGDGPCPSDLEPCDGACVDLHKDKDNCGSCGYSCQPGQLCAKGECATKMRVFVSMPTDGHFGGLEAANARCNEEADDANLPGEYRAWLSTQQTSPSEAFNKLGAYVLPGGQVVAWSWEDLTDGQLNTPINQTALGQPVPPMDGCPFEVAVWTGTAADGTKSGPFCDWSPNTEGGAGRAGNAKATDSNWTDSNCTPDCGVKLGLYCVQQ